MSKIIVHHLELSRSFRVLWLLEDLNVPYEVKHYKRNDEGIAALYKIHPLGKSPVITEANGNVIAETGVIFEYLLDKYDKGHKLAPPYGTKERQAVQYWLHYSEGSFMAAGLVFYYTRKAGADLKGAQERLELHLKYIEGVLSKHEWLVGDSFTAADINLEFPVEFSAILPEIDFSKYPKVSAWREKIKQQAGYKKALKSNGEYDVAAIHRSIKKGERKFLLIDYTSSFKLENSPFKMETSPFKLENKDSQLPHVTSVL